MTDTALSLADQVWAQLQATPAVNVYDGEVVDADGQQATPPADADGRVHAYAVFYPGPGWHHPRMLDATPDTLDWTFQITCAGGDRTRALWAIGQVRGALAGFHVTNAHGQHLAVTEVGDPGPLRRDDDVTPSRQWAPLTFTVTA